MDRNWLGRPQAGVGRSSSFHHLPARARRLSDLPSAQIMPRRILLSLSSYSESLAGRAPGNLVLAVTPARAGPGAAAATEPPAGAAEALPGKGCQCPAEVAGIQLTNLTIS